MCVCVRVRVSLTELWLTLIGLGAERGRALEHGLVAKTANLPLHLLAYARKEEPCACALRVNNSLCLCYQKGGDWYIFQRW